MKLDILELILWSKKEHAPRRVKFRPGKLNIISGDSKTGKSAIIPIIDYCLCSQECAIPTGKIRNACSWFGIIVDTVEGKKLIARREPGAQKSTGNMYVLQGDELLFSEQGEAIIPKHIDSHNSGIDYVRDLLNRLSGTSNMKLEPDSEAINSHRPSIRDFMAFVFQPQNVVANPDVFFFKADTTAHREKLKTVFPYVLGAVDAETLINRARLDRLSKELKRKERELANVSKVSDAWQSEALSWLDRAKELGLVLDDKSQPIDWPSLIDLLRKISDRSFRDSRPEVSSIDQALLNTLKMIDEETLLASEVYELKQRYKELKFLRYASDEHNKALAIQKDRLSLSTWLKDLTLEDHTHLLFDPRISPSAELDLLCNSLAHIEAEAKSRPSSNESLDGEITRLNQQLNDKLEELKAIRTRLETQRGLERTKEPSYSISNIERFLGQLDFALNTYEKIGADSALSDEIDKLQMLVNNLRKSVSETKIRKKTENALKIVQGIAGKIIPKLDCEFVDLPVELSINELSIKVVGPERKDWLWEIGSGANWLAYHISVSIALQRYFMKTPSHPVPHLLVYDQPSQVYFPRKLADTQATDKDSQGKPIELNDKDIIAVKKVFQTLSEETLEAEGKLQVIILDHAASDVWGG